jgi:hypothetical protein
VQPEVVLNKIGGVLFYQFWNGIWFSGCESDTVFRALVGILQLPFGDLSPHIF